MSMRIRVMGCVLLALSWAQWGVRGGEPIMSKSGQTNEVPLRDRVEAAVQAARTGEFSLLSELQDQAAAAVPWLSAYVHDANEDVRSQVAAMLGLSGQRDAIGPLVSLLADSSPDVCRRAGQALYGRFPRAWVASHPEAGRVMAESVMTGNTDAAVLLLLGWFPVPASEAALRATLLRRGDGPTELQAWAPVVPAALPAKVALSRLGDEAARLDLARTAAAGSLPETLFLLSVLGDIDAPETLRALGRALGDLREAPGQTPSGAGPARRVCDVAVDALVERLGLSVEFPRSRYRRYEAAQIDAVRSALNQAL